MNEWAIVGLFFGNVACVAMNLKAAESSKGWLRAAAFAVASANFAIMLWLLLARLA